MGERMYLSMSTQDVCKDDEEETKEKEERKEKEKHYTVADLAKEWNLSPKTIIRLFENRPGVMLIEGPEIKGRKRQRKHRTMRIPQSVRDAVHKELTGG